MKVLAAEQLGLPFAGDALALLRLGSGGFLNFHRLLLRVLKNLDSFEIPRQVNQVEMRSIHFWMQNDGVAAKVKSADRLCVTSVLFYGGVFSFKLREALHLCPE